MKPERRGTVSFDGLNKTRFISGLKIGEETDMVLHLDDVPWFKLRVKKTGETMDGTETFAVIGQVKI